MTLKNNHTLLFVDDEKSITKALQRLFRKEGYHILMADSGQQGLEILNQFEKTVSMIVSDQRMPGMNGAEFLAKAKDIYPDAVRYLLTGYSDMDAVIQAINKGQIHRYLTKPWNDEDLILQVRQSLEHYELVAENKRLTELTAQQNAQLKVYNKDLESQVEARSAKIIQQYKALEKINQMLEASFMDSVRLLAGFVESINPNLGRQMRQVAQIARKVGQQLNLNEKELDRIEMAGMIHDIGLLGVPESLWCKKVSNMTEEQYQMFSEHPVVGSIILENVEQLAGVGEIVLFHHEYVNGNGFPNGLKKFQIPLGSKIILAVSDYLNIINTWPRDLSKLIKYARRQFDDATWKSFTLSDDPDTVVEEAAEKKLLLDANKKYDIEVLSALIKVIRKSRNIAPSYTIALDQVKADMILVEDLRLNDGRLLLTKGTKLKEAALRSIQSIGERGMIPDKLVVTMPSKN